MNYDLSYCEKNINNDIIDSKLNYLNNTNNVIINLQNKIEELQHKLNFVNSSSKISIDINDTVHDLINNDNINNILEKSQSNKLNIIEVIDNVILKLNKKIICQGQIKRNDDFVELEF